MQFASIPELPESSQKGSVSMSGQQSASLRTSGHSLEDEKSSPGPLILAGITFIICVFLFLAADDAALRYSQYVVVWDTIQALSLALIPAIIVATYDHYRTIGETSSRVARIIGKDLGELVTGEINALLQGRDTYGLVAFRDKMDFSALFQSLQSGDALLWHDTYAPAEELFVNYLQDAIARGVHVRMLAIDAASQNAHYRAEEIANPVIRREFLRGAEQFPATIGGLLSQKSGTVAGGGSIEIRLYHDLPCLPMYIVRHDERLVKGYSSFFLTKPTGIDFVHVEWAPTARRTGLLEDMAAYFDQKWEAQAQPGGGGTIFKLTAAGVEIPVKPDVGMRPS